jgi:hypothetical protein
MFGGHEKGGILMTNWTDGVCVCPHCADEAALRNTLWRMTNEATRPLLEKWRCNDENLL